MIKRDITQLAVYQIEEDVNTLPLACLQELYLNKTSEIVYVTKREKLYGVVCLGDVVHHSRNGEVRVNKNFTTLTGYNVIKAYEIFQTRGNIHKIPVVNKQGELLGDYSRWDDQLYIDRNQEKLMKKEIVEKILESYEKVYVIEPIENEKTNYIHLLKYLRQCQVEYVILNKREINDRLSEKSIYIFLNEEERRGVQCLYGFSLDQYEMLRDMQRDVRFTTYAHLLCQIVQEQDGLLLKHGSSKNFPMINSLQPDRMRLLGERAAVLCSALKKSDIKFFFIYVEENEITEYGRDFKGKVEERVKAYPVDSQGSWPKRGKNKAYFEEFYGELCQVEDYEKELAQKEIFDANLAMGYQKEIVGKYFNAKEGKRVTCFQPDKYLGTIYLLGPCTIIGLYSEDQYTIGSYLQRKLLEQGYQYRVENYGSIFRNDSEIDSKLLEIGKCQTSDVVIMLLNTRDIGMPGISLEKIFEKYQIPSEWVTDGYLHCNHKVNQLIADALIEMMEPCLLKEMVESVVDKQIDVHGVMNDYVQRKYLNRYFNNLQINRYRAVGSIVMNCNPFTKGHRYLIECARQQVEFLIVFVVEEDASLFPFEERFRMVVEGTKDLSSIMVVPSGDFIISNFTFYEYFTKEETEEIIVKKAEYDINIFAEYIAKPLRVTHRFAGEELEDKVTKIYNETMKRILSQEGIVFTEIPRMVEDDEIVSASRVRKYLRNEEYDKAFAMIPETTKRYLMEQIDIKGEENGKSNTIQ